MGFNARHLAVSVSYAWEGMGDVDGDRSFSRVRGSGSGELMIGRLGMRGAWTPVDALETPVTLPSETSRDIRNLKRLIRLNFY